LNIVSAEGIHMRYKFLMQNNINDHLGLVLLNIAAT